MRCDEAMELLSAAADGEVTPAQQGELDQHLAQCPACRAIQTELLGLRAACGGLDVAAPAELKTAVMEHLPPQKAPTKGLYWRRWGAMAAAVALVALAAWQLPRFVLDPPKPNDSSTQVTMALDVPEEAPLSDSFTGGPETDDELPPYVEGDGVNVNSYMGSPPPAGDSSMVADEAVYEMFLDSTDNGTDLTAAKATVQGQTPDPAQTAPVFTSGAVDPSTADTDAVTGGGSIVAMSKRSAESGVADLAAPTSEPAPEPFMYSAAVTSAAEDEKAVDAFPETASVNQADAPAFSRSAETQSPFVTYCGVLTLAEYVPSDQEYTVEFSEGGLAHYLLPAQDFFALVDQLIDRELPFELRAQGEDIDPGATCGLVVVTGTAPEQEPDQTP